MEDKNLETTHEEREDEDRLDIIIGLVAWIPSSLQTLMHSDDNADLLYLSIMFLMSILFLRFKNDKIVPFIKGGK